MDIPTRVGLGGTALFTLAGMGEPLWGWWIAGPIMVVCAVVAGWGFWPLVRDLLRIPTRSGRMPVTELLKIAAESGWDFTSNDSLHLLDLQDAMRQGGVDGALTIWGRRYKWTDNSLMRKEPLEQIPSAHWKDYFVHLFAAREVDSFNTYSWSALTNPYGQRGYLDLHVNRSQATNWLRTKDALSFKGKTR